MLDVNQSAPEQKEEVAVPEPNLNKDVDKTPHRCVKCK